MFKFRNLLSLSPSILFFTAVQFTMKLQKANSRTLLLFLCCLQAISLAQTSNFFSQQYGNPFNETYYPNFKVFSPATITNGAIQVTPDSISDSFKLVNRSGRVFLGRSFKLWEKHNSNTNGSRVASFNSSFLINMYRPFNDTPAEGLSFLISSQLDIPLNSYGAFLGLTNSTTDGNSTNKFVAVEFDTFKQDFDPDDNHLGLDINSVKSVKFASLAPFGIILSPKGVKRYNVWVNYDGVSKIIEIYMAEQATLHGLTPLRPSSPVLQSVLDLSEYVNQHSYFGFSASTGVYSQLNCVLRWNLTVEIIPENKNPGLKIGLGVCLPVLVLVLMTGAWFGYNFHKKKMGSSSSIIRGALKSLPGSPKEYDYWELKKGTNNFDEKNKLGQGGFGAVYKGMLVSENMEIAVKCFLRESIKGQDDFLAELTIINRLRHRHLVRLLGWCYKNCKLLLVYEYMPNGSLDQHLFAGPNKPPLSWNLRYKIISGVASALHYLHDEYDQRVVHRDLKASNIMLDSNFNARLGDFGLARVIENEKNSYTEAAGIPGTFGYIAPECFHTGKATQQSDVYAFGAVLLEVACGMRPGTSIADFISLVDWVWYLHRDGRVLEAVDQRLGVDYVGEEAEKILVLGLACSHPMANERPKTQVIVQILSGLAPIPYVPPFKPAFVWPGTLPKDIDSSTSNTTWVSSEISSEYRQHDASQENNS